MGRPKVVVAVQARMTSTRLPGKVMLPLAQKPLLLRMVERLRLAKTVDQIVVATTTDDSAEPIRNLCKQEQIDCMSGHPTDLLDRHLEVGKRFKADALVKIPSDCPLIDPLIVDQTINVFIDDPGSYDFVTNLHPPSYPDGNDVELMTMDALVRAHQEATEAFQREHTTPYLWDNPQKFRLKNVPWESGDDLSKSHRWTIDYLEDYEFISKVYEKLWRSENEAFSLNDILSLLKRHPEFNDCNEMHSGSTWHKNHIHQLKHYKGV